MRRLFVVSEASAKRLKKADIGRDYKIITSDVGSENVLNSAGICYRKLDDYDNNEPDYFMEASKLLRKWGRKEIHGRKMKSFFEHDCMPFWRVLESGLLVFLSDQTKALKYVNCVKKAIEKEKPDIIISDGCGVLGTICKAVADISGIKHKTLKPGIRKRLNIMNKSRVFDYSYKYLLRLKGFRRGKTVAMDTGAKGKKNKILVIPYIQTMIQIITPVIEELEKNPDNEIIVIKYDLLRDRMKKEMERANLRYKDIESYKTKASEKATRGTVSFLKLSWNSLKKDMDFRQLFLYQDIPVWDIMKDAFIYYFSTRSRINEIVSYIEMMRNVLEIEKPDIVVTLDESSCVGLPTMILSKDLKVPTLSIQHGTPLVDSGPVIVDKMAVWGEQMKRNLVSRGFKPDQIVVTGCPKNDTIYRNISRNNKIRQEIGVPDGTDMIIFASQPITANEMYLKMLFGAVKKLPGKLLVVKTHPRETNLSIYKRVAKSVGIEIIIERGHLYDLLNACDLMITMSSTVATDAILLGKTVMIFNPINRDNLEMYVGKGVVSGVFDGGKLASEINKVLKDKATRDRLKKNAASFIADYAYKMDGQSSKRVVDVINSMIKNQDWQSVALQQ